MNAILDENIIHKSSLKVDNSSDKVILISKIQEKHKTKKHWKKLSSTNATSTVQQDYESIKAGQADQRENRQGIGKKTASITEANSVDQFLAIAAVEGQKSNDNNGIVYKSSLEEEIPKLDTHSFKDYATVKELPVAAAPSKASDIPLEKPQKVASEESESESSDIGRPKGLSADHETTMDQDHPAAARYAEAVRHSKTHRKKRIEEEVDDVLIGVKVSEGHANWVMAYNMLTGIRYAVSKTVAKMDRELTDEDFTAEFKYSFDVTGTELTPFAKYDFRFKDYSPWVFRKIRELFNVDPADYLISLTGKYVLSEMGTPGKSGSFFYFSRDYRFIIKTIHSSEHKFLRRILKNYFKHVQNSHDTLISQFFGLHRVKQPFGKKVHFVVMNNLFPAHHDIHQTYDLKGSLVGRYFDEKLAEAKPRYTLKDLNWIQRKMCLLMGPMKREQFLSVVKKDLQFLTEMGIMDYSLLIGIHDVKRRNMEHVLDATLSVFNPAISQGGQQDDLNSMSARKLKRAISLTAPIPLEQGSPEFRENQYESRRLFNLNQGGFRASYADNSPANFIYYLGIIDLLTKYTSYKKVENFIKGLRHPKNQISAIPPQIYAQRLFNFLRGNIKSIKNPTNKLLKSSPHLQH